MSSLVWDVAIYAYGAEGAFAKFLGWTRAAGAWIENEEALYLFTVGADGTLQMFKNGHCIGTTKAKPRRPTRGQVAHPRSLAIERRERRRLAVVRVRAARGPWKSSAHWHLLLHYSLIWTHVNTRTVEVNKPQTYSPPSKMIPPPRARNADPSGRASAPTSQEARSASQTFMS